MNYCTSVLGFRLLLLLFFSLLILRMGEGKDGEEKTINKMTGQLSGGQQRRGKSLMMETPILILLGWKLIKGCFTTENNFL